MSEPREHDAHPTTPHIPQDPVSPEEWEQASIMPSPGETPSVPGGAPAPGGGHPAAAPPAPPYQGGELSRAAEAGRARGVGAVSHPHARPPASPRWHAMAVTDARAVTPSLWPQLPQNPRQPAQPQRCCRAPSHEGTTPVFTASTVDVVHPSMPWVLRACPGSAETQTRGPL